MTLGSADITVAAPPTVNDVTSQTLASMAALTGVVTDYNEGSQVRTFTEANAAVIEQQGVWSQALAFQAAVYGALAAFNITPNLATAASGQQTFATSLASGAPPVNQTVAIPSGTIVQTAGNVQFLTNAAAILASGASSVTVGIVAALGGTAGNVPAGSITNIVNGLAYPLITYNAAATGGGSNAESPSQTLARFASARASLPAATPLAIANAAIGMTVSGTGETVAFSTCYEPWTVLGSGYPGYDVYIDNGFGTASAALIGVVTSGLYSTTANPFGYRAAGVPYSVLAVTPTYAVVVVSGVVNSLGNVNSVSGAMATAISGYFALPFGATAQQGQIAAVASNAALGLLSSFDVALYVSGSPTAVSGITPAVSGRVVLGGINMLVT